MLTHISGLHFKLLDRFNKNYRIHERGKVFFYIKLSKDRCLKYSEM